MKMDKSNTIKASKKKEEEEERKERTIWKSLFKK
jgi:hypothetical protein